MPNTRARPIMMRVFERTAGVLMKVFYLSGHALPMNPP
jgi:hypothetical protein